ncbi:uncharacterized protein [Coffea arabica]|uniref:ATP-dependent DNA helicase n=1 Tax=Coffea arabica TaxID=13443 RepID=A0A6P6WYH7_COFAR|nr:uncharacterized protein LOC113737554 [Coffea arabica]
MDRNAKRRKRYAEMPQEKKEDLLRCRREANAARKKNVTLPPPFPGSETRLLKRRRATGVQQTASTTVGTVVCSDASASQCPAPGQSDFVEQDRVAIDAHGLTSLADSISSTPNASEIAISSLSGLPAVPTQAANTGKRKRVTKRSLPRLNKIAEKVLPLPYAPPCQYCGAQQFHMEPPNFCCSEGGVSLVSSSMPYDLRRLFTGEDEECEHFRKNARTYNNNVAFTSLGAKYDKELTKNKNGLYTFRVQGQVYHFLEGLQARDAKASGIQLYFFDTDEELARRVDGSPKLRETTLRLLLSILADNPYAKFFKDLRSVPNLDDHRIILNCNVSLDQRVYNLPTASQVAAIWTGDGDESTNASAHIQVYSHSDTSHKIKHFYSCYDSLQYPLLFPREECGWHPGIQRVQEHSKKRSSRTCKDQTIVDPTSLANASQLIDSEERAVENGKRQKSNVTAREYYCYKLQMRPNDDSMLLHTLRLLQQYSVDIYVKIETSRLVFHRKKQNEIQTEALKGIMDSVSAGETSGSRVGRRVLLPASFIGGPRDMRHRYLDAMSLVQRYGKPSIFLTMTCNPMWREIQDNLMYKEKAHDRPDLLSRVFRAKFELLKAEILNKKIFGDVAACVYVIEFQKRGYPHAHMLLILKHRFKPLNPEAYDRIKSLSKRILPQTSHAEDCYPSYRRRNDGKRVKVRRYDLDNRWVVPYNPYLLPLFDCHMNVEICSTIKLVKYLYKYIFKGHDLVNFHIIAQNTSDDVDEIREFQQGRWVSPPEALWRIYGFRLNEMTPAVYTLQVHLPDQQYVSFDRNVDLLNLLSQIDLSKTMLTEFFEMNKTNKKAQDLKCLYRDFPQYFVWAPAKRAWSERSRRKVIGRLVTVSPSEGDRYYLRLLLSHVRCPTSFDDLLAVDGQTMSSFREAALKLGLLNSDSYIEDTLEEAAGFQMPSSLRFLFATLLLCCSPANPHFLWEKFEAEMSRDFLRSHPSHEYCSDEIKRKVLLDINKTLEQMGRHITDYHLHSDCFSLNCQDRVTKEVDNERNIEVTPEDLLISSKLNAEQRYAYDLILQSVFSSEGKAYFVDGPGGTGKTFLYRSLLATLRSQGYIAIAVATSGVAASILPGGRTAHSRFKIPLDCSRNRTCQLSKQSSTSKLIAECKLLLWDEASMARKETIEAFDELLRDIMESNEPFGGKVVVFGGDYRQTLPVIQGATRDQLVGSSLVSSTLWSKMLRLRLTENMRALSDPSFSQFLLRVGEGLEPMDEDNQICLPSNIVVPFVNAETSLNRLLHCVFPDLNACWNDPYKLINRCILTPKNASVDDLNEVLINRFPGQLHVYTSSDRTLDQRHQSDYEDFLNSQNPKGLPPHKLLLKENCPLILLRKLNPLEGLCNGTRLICRQLLRHTICAEIAFGQHRGKTIFIPKIPLQTSDTEKNGIPFIRTQFPVRLCFAMTINKAQGQTLDYVGIYLREPVFSHGQLYVALSRAKSAAVVKVLILPGTFDDVKLDCKTRNVVFTEILELSG